MSAKRKESAPDLQPQKMTRFFRVHQFGILPGEFHPSYQAEILELRGDEIVKRYWKGKRDTKQQVMAELELMNDPDNQEFEG